MKHAWAGKADIQSKVVSRECTNASLGNSIYPQPRRLEARALCPLLPPRPMVLPPGAIPDRGIDISNLRNRDNNRLAPSAGQPLLGRFWGTSGAVTEKSSRNIVLEVDVRGDGIEKSSAVIWESSRNFSWPAQWKDVSLQSSQHEGQHATRGEVMVLSPKFHCSTECLSLCLCCC